MGIQANHIGIDPEDYRIGHEYLFRGISSLSQHTQPHLELEENRILDSDLMGDYAKCEAFSHTQGLIYNPNVVSGNDHLPFETHGNAIEHNYAFEVHFDSKKHHPLSSMEQGNQINEREEVGFMDNPNVYKERDYPSEFPAIEPNYAFEMHFNSKKHQPLSSMEEGNQTHKREEVGFMDDSHIYEESEFPAIEPNYAFEMHFDSKKHHPLSAMEQGNQTNEREEVGFMDNPNIYEESDFPSKFPSHIGGLTKAQRGSKGPAFDIVPEEGIKDNTESECNSYYLDYFSSQTPRSLNAQSLHGITSLSELSVLDVVSEDRPLGELCPFNMEKNNKEWDTLSSSSSGSETSLESSYEGPLDCLTSLLDSLPVKKGLSRFYSGKSRSFSCLSDVVSLKDVVKIENPLNTKRRRMNSSRFGPRRQNNTGGISKKNPHNGKTTLALAVAMSKNEDIDRRLHPSIPSRSLSLSDLRVDR